MKLTGTVTTGGLLAACTQPTTRQRYWQFVKGMSGANLVAYWPLSESSGSIARDISGNGYHGAYTGVPLAQSGIGDGSTAAAFSSSRVNLYSPGLSAAFNGDEGFFSAWVKLSGWTGTSNMVAYLSYIDSNPRIYIQQNAANLMTFYRDTPAASVYLSVHCDLTSWMHIGLTWSVSSDRLRVYINGVQYGVDQTGLAAWGADHAPTSNSMVLGSRYGTSQGDSWVGTMAHAMLGNVEATPDQMWAMARPFIHPSGLAIIGFDTGVSTVYTEYYPLMAAQKIIGQVSVVSKWTGSGGYMTWEQLRTLEAAGWAIINETVNHYDLTTLTAAQIDAELANCKNAMISNGLTGGGCRHVDYPYGAVNATVRAEMGTQGMLTGRLASQNRGGLPKVDALTDIPDWYFKAGSWSLTTAKNAILSAWVTNQVANCIFHDADPTSDFSSLLTTIKQYGVPCGTIYNYYARAAL